MPESPFPPTLSGGTLSRESLTSKLPASALLRVSSAEPGAGPLGAQLVVIPDGGRVCGMFLDGHDENVFWTPDDGVGGHRVWVAPEYRYFWTGPPDLERFTNNPTPPSLDPGPWRVSLVDDGVLAE
eukprot:gene4525-4753_t